MSTFPLCKARILFPYKLFSIPSVTYKLASVSDLSHASISDLALLFGAFSCTRPSVFLFLFQTLFNSQCCCLLSCSPLFILHSQCQALFLTPCQYQTLIQSSFLLVVLFYLFVPSASGTHIDLGPSLTTRKSYPSRVHYPSSCLD